MIYGIDFPKYTKYLLRLRTRQRINLCTFATVEIPSPLVDEPMPYGLGGVPLSADERYLCVGAGTGVNFPPPAGRGFDYSGQVTIRHFVWIVDLANGNKELIYAIDHPEELCHCHFSPRDPDMIFVMVHNFAKYRYRTKYESCLIVIR